MGATNVLCVDDAIGNGPGMVFDVNNNRDILSYYLNDAEVFALMSNGFIRTTTGWGTRMATVGIGDIAANNDAYTYPIFRAKNDVTIVSCHVGVDATVAANATNYQTIYLEQSGNSNDLGSITTATVAITAKVPREITVATTNNQDHLAAGDTLQLRFEKAASGVIAYGMTVSIAYTIDQPRATIGTATDNVMRLINEAGTGAELKLDFAHRPFLSVRENGNERFQIDIDGVIRGSTQAGMTDYAPVDQYYYEVINVGQIVTADSAAKKSPIFAPHCTIQLENVYFGAITTYALDSAANGWQIKITDATDVLVDAYTHLYGAGTALTKGVLYDMGDVNRELGRLTSSDKLCVEYLQTGTGPNIDGLTIVLVYRKLT
jgi:hypothetical protein